MGNNNQRRNVLLIMCDQLRPDFLGAYGADFISTPNIDALAAEGVVYDNAITASTVCAPARMSFLTGKFVSDHDVWTNNVVPAEGTEFLPERMAEAGYLTAAVGNFDHYPNDASFGYQYKKIECDGYKGCDYTPEFKERHPDEPHGYPQGEDNHFKYPEEEFYDRWSADRAVDFIQSYAKTGKAPNGAQGKEEDAPFFLYCGFLSPHTPLIPPQEVKGTVDPDKLPPVTIQERPDSDIADIELYRRTFLNPPEVLADPHALDEQRLKERILYAELIVEVDALVGRIVQSLKDNGLYENTTIVLTADHGSCENDYNVLTKGPWPYSPQLFIPMIISNHPGLEKGTHCDALCGNLDVGGTLLDIAGDEKAFGVSRSMIGLADGSAPERDVNMSEFCDGCKTIVDKRYTFTYYPFTGKTCLFDRIEDPKTQNNLSGKPEYAEIEKKFLMDVVDFMIISKGVRIEAHDLSPNIKAGIEKKHPKFLDTFDICYPICSWGWIARLEKAGLDATYNEFCREREITACYAAYFNTERPENL